MEPEARHCWKCLLCWQRGHWLIKSPGDLFPLPSQNSQPPFCPSFYKPWSIYLCGHVPARGSSLRAGTAPHPRLLQGAWGGEEDKGKECAY